jgi:putative component of membrane protein insertase Oxa1/YidC/SpoIIIJ protein YidD
VERFGAARGSWLALTRLLRCQPLSRKFGYDPVPDAPHHTDAVTPEEAHS